MVALVYMRFRCCGRKMATAPDLRDFSAPSCLVQQISWGGGFRQSEPANCVPLFRAHDQNLRLAFGTPDSGLAESQYIFSPDMRRPPDPQLLGFLEAYDRPVADLALALREIILEEVPDASESIYRVYTVAIWFGFSGKMKDMFCYIATNARHINLGFPRGSTLPDPNRVLEGGLHFIVRVYPNRFPDHRMLS